jgi:hypothetical protein
MTRGRPKLSDEDRQSAVVTLRMTVEERDTIQKAAGENCSEWCRKALLEKINPPKKLVNNQLTWYDNKGQVMLHISTPNPLSVEDWKSLCAYVETVLKPREEPQP